MLLAPNSLQRMVPCSIWTPSWSHCTSWSTTGGSSSTLRSRPEQDVRPCLPTPRLPPWPSSPSSGPASEASEISGALLRHICAPTLPEALFPKPTQPQGAHCGARVARLPACSGPNALWRFGGLPSVLDTTLIPAMVRVRASRKGLFGGQAIFGRSASKTEWVYGFSRWHSRSAQRALPLRLRAGGGSLRGAPHSRLSHHRGLSGDLPSRQGLYGRGVGATLVGSVEHWYRPLPKTTPRGRGRKATVAGRRESGRSIEGVIDQLKDLFALERHRAKTLGGLLARLAAKMAAYTSCGQRLNDQLGRPLRHLADLLV